MRDFSHQRDQGVWRDPLELKHDQSFRGLSVLIATSCLFLMLTLILLSSALIQTRFGSSLGASNAALVVPLGVDQDESEITQGLLAVLQSFDEIENAVAVPAEKRKRLLQPWLGTSNEAQTLPILLEFNLNSEATQIAGLLERVAARAAGVVENAQVYSNQEWQEQGEKTRRVYLWMLILLMLSAMGSMIATLFFATRAILRAQVRNIDILETLGADAGFMRRIFTSFAVRKGFIAGCVSSLFVLLGWLCLSFLLPKEGLGGVDFQLTYWPTLIVACLTPFLASFLSWFGAVWGFREAQAVK